MKKLNITLIGLHLISAILFIWAFNQLFWLYDTDLMQEYLENGVASTNLFGEEKLMNLLIAQAIASLIGLLLSFLVSLTIVVKNKKGFINSVIVLVLALLLNRFELLNSDIIKQIITFPGKALFDSFIWTTLSNAIILILISLWIQFSKLTNKMI